MSALSDFEGRLAIVTGAAEGIGAMLAEGFARHGMDVALLDIQQDAATATAAASPLAGGTDPRRWRAPQSIPGSSDATIASAAAPPAAG